MPGIVVIHIVGDLPSVTVGGEVIDDLLIEADERTEALTQRRRHPPLS